MAQENLELYFVGIRLSVGKEMAGSRHTLTSCLSKLRSSLEAGKKQLRVWLQHACSGAKVFLLYSSFSVPLVLLWSSYGDLEMSWGALGDVTEMYASSNICFCANEDGFDIS